jgi:hypothetical protein
MHLNVPLKIHVEFGPCSMQTEPSLTTLSAKHLYVAGENGPDNALFHKLPRIQSHMTQLAAVGTGEHMTKPLRHLL